MTNRLFLVCSVILLQLSLLSCRPSDREVPYAEADWPSYNGSYQSTRFSKLSEITRENAAGLRQLCTYVLPEHSKFESSLVAVNGILYFTTFEWTYALDAETCALKWRTKEAQVWPGGTVRGVAYENGRVFRG